MHHLHLRILKETTLQINGKSENHDWLPVKCRAPVQQSVTTYVIGTSWCNFSSWNDMFQLTLLVSHANFRIKNISTVLQILLHGVLQDNRRILTFFYSPIHFFSY